MPQPTKHWILPAALAFGLILALGPIAMPPAAPFLPSAQISPSSALSAPVAHAAASFNTTLTMPDNSLGLVGHWTFDGPDMINNVADTSGQGNNGTFFGMSTTTIPGVLGQAINFTQAPAGNAGINVGSPASLTDLFASGTSTISLWYYVPPGVAELDTMVSKSWGLAAYTTVSRGLSFTARFSSNNGTWTPPLGSFTTGKWYHAVVEYAGTSASNVPVMYLNGVSLAVSTNSTPAGTIDSDSSSNLNIANENGSGTGFNGYMDDVRIYNRALSAAEVAELYREGEGSHQNTTITPLNLSTGLVGHWTFDGPDMINNVADTSGQGLNGHLVGFTSTTTAPGIVGQALHFGATNDEVDVGDISVLNGANAVSWSFWLKPDSLSGSRILSKWGASGTQQGWLINMGASGQVAFADQNQQNCGVYQIETTNGVIQAGEWNDVVVTLTTSGATIFVNSIAQPLTVLSNYCPTPIGNDTSDLQFGHESNENGNSFIGSLDDVRIYNRALSASEVATLYRVGQGGIQNVTPANMTQYNPGDITSGLIAWWKFDDGSGSSAVDSVGVHTGTLVNSPTWAAGKVGGALSFNGTNQYITLSYGVSLSPPFTIATWVYPLSSGTTWTFTGGSSNSSPSLRVTSGGKIQLLEENVAGLYTSNGTIPFNTWSHIVFVYEGATTHLYINGVADPNTSSTNYTSFTSLNRLAENGSPGSEYFSGSLDDLRIYNRALSAQDALKLYDDSIGTYTSGYNPEPGLVGHWTFDGKDMIKNVADTSGQGNNGNLVSYTATTTTPGVLGQALTFSSALGQNVEILSRNGFSTGSGSKWSFSAWVKPTAADLDSSYHMLVSYGQVGTGELPDIDINSGGHWAMSCYGGYSISDSTTVQTGVWTHVVGTYDGTNMRLYLNGSLAVGPTAETGCAPTNASAAIGAQAGTGSFPFDGALDDVRVYSRALSASEVLHLYKLGR